MTPPSIKTDLRREEIFAQALYDLLCDEPLARQGFFAAHAGFAPEGNLQVRHRDRRHVVAGKRIELDLFVLDKTSAALLVVELKGAGGSEMPGQTAEIAEAIATHFPEHDATLVFATPDGQRATSPAFRSMALDDLVEPLRTLAGDVPAIERFLTRYDRDTTDEALRQRRREAKDDIKRLATCLLDHARELIATRSELAGFTAQIERSYSGHAAAVQLGRPDADWVGFKLYYDVRRVQTGALAARACLLKHGQRNVTWLKALRGFLDDHPVAAWLEHPDIEVHDQFSAKHNELNVASYAPTHFSGPDWTEHLTEVLDMFLVPAIPVLDAFIAAHCEQLT